MKRRAIVTTKVFRNGRSQAVRIPKEFRFDCDEVVIERRGGAIVLTPRAKSWKGFFARLVPLSDDFTIPDDPPPEPTPDF
jgi:antitoxin VapB